MDYRLKSELKGVSVILMRDRDKRSQQREREHELQRAIDHDYGVGRRADGRIQPLIAEDE